jgi:TolA-binding protein
MNELGTANSVAWDVESAWERHQKWIVAGILAAMVAAGISAVLWMRHHDREIAAQDALLRAKGAEAQGAVAREHAGTAAAPLAWMAAGDAALAAGDTKAAEGYYREVVSKYPTHPLASAAWMGLGLALEIKEDRAGAMEAYRAVTTRYPQSFRAAEAWCAVGKVLKKNGDRAGAREAFERVVNGYADSVWRSQAEEWLEELGPKSNGAEGAKGGS